MNLFVGSCWDARVLSSVAAQSTASSRATELGTAPELQILLDRLGPFLPQAGITRVGVVTGLDVIGIPVVMVVRPESRSLSVAQGKGTSLVAAKVSGVMEALEHYHAETADLCLRWASQHELRRSGKTATAPARFARTATVLSEDTPLLWALGQSMLDGSDVWVPHELVHLDYRDPLPAGSGLFRGSSAGLAGGTTRLEAEQSALLELVERHETATFYALDAVNQEQCRVDLASVSHDTCRSLLARFEQAEIAVSVWDISDEFGVPCFFCELIDRHRDPLRVLGCARGMGCHFDAGIALERALCEAAQSRLTVIAGTRDDITGIEVRQSRTLRAYERALTRSDGDGRVARPDSAVRIDSVSVGNARAQLLARLQAGGYGPPVVVDLSKTGWPAHFVRVIIPGLRTTAAVAHPSSEAP